MTLYVLIVTSFYFNQSPVNYQTEFTSAELCEDAKVPGLICSTKKSGSGRNPRNDQNKSRLAAS
jgi:hypothetical protein